MSTQQILIDSAERIFADHCDKPLQDLAETGEFPAELWQVLKDNGFAELANVDSGFELADVFAVLKVAGRYGVPLPLAESLLGNRWLAQSGRLASVGVSIGGEVCDVPWGRTAEVVIGLGAEDGAENGAEDGAAGGAPVVLDAPTTAAQGANMAGEPRDRMNGTSSPVATDEPCFELLALARVVQMAGGLERILELALQYANEREQFGRPIARFQAIQHNLAIMASETAAAVRSADAAVDAIGSERFALEVAAAKARGGEAAGVCAEIAHQVHGAMGFTHEHQLHHFTRRVWAWRDEMGNETYWRRRLGAHIAGLGADSVWSFLATRG
ncbi:MAG: acyl-CoA dehydrogenase family protein [Gammaproteobacteria bacterium]|nr:acyl-CoA dehydrogenase family protein [Gammaproteobacteria bacterium]